MEEKKHPNSNKKETRNDNNPYDEEERKWAWGETKKQFAVSTQAPVQKSIYHMTEESIPNRETRKKLSFCRQKGEWGIRNSAINTTQNWLGTRRHLRLGDLPCTKREGN